MTGLPERLRDARKAKGFSQAGLADAVGVRPQTIWRYETGAQEPGVAILSRIADACGVQIDWLVKGEAA